MSEQPSVEDRIAEARREVFASLPDLCAICGQSGVDAIDHVAPMFSAGDPLNGNVRVVHAACVARRL